MIKSACIAGASGLVGKEVLDLLLQNPDYSTVYSLVRKPSGIFHSKLKELVVDFDAHPFRFIEIVDVDDVFCCLGTTMKNAGSKDAFRKVDYVYPLEIAKWARKVNAKKFLSISAMGADASSGIFYSKVKGDLEKAVGGLGIPYVVFFRPSILAGDRKESRPGEKAALMIMRALSFLFVGPLKNYKAVSVRKVALAMLQFASNEKKGVEIVLSGAMQDIKI